MKHPRQREMWEGLDRSGCLMILVLIAVATIMGVIL
jgi:hypothetical protein